jgi:hypothetical protein
MKAAESLGEVMLVLVKTMVVVESSGEVMHSLKIA